MCRINVFGRRSWEIGRFEKPIILYNDLTYLGNDGLGCEKGPLKHLLEHASVGFIHLGDLLHIVDCCFMSSLAKTADQLSPCRLAFLPFDMLSHSYLDGMSHWCLEPIIEILEVHHYPSTMCLSPFIACLHPHDCYFSQKRLVHPYRLEVGNPSPYSLRLQRLEKSDPLLERLAD